jgi:YggT family protein
MPEMAAMTDASILLADWVSSAQNFVQVFVWVYVLLIFAYIITSWIRLPYSLWMQRIQGFLYDVCEPYLRLFRRILPPLGPIDLSPMIAVFVLFIAGRIVIELLDRAG